MHPLSDAERDAFVEAIRLFATANPGVGGGGVELPVQYARRQLAVLDEYRSGMALREHYDLRYRTWLEQRVGLDAGLLAAVDAHCRGE